MKKLNIKFNEIMIKENDIYVVTENTTLVKGLASKVDNFPIFINNLIIGGSGN